MRYVGAFLRRFARRCPLSPFSPAPGGSLPFVGACPGLAPAFHAKRRKPMPSPPEFLSAVRALSRVNIFFADCPSLMFFVSALPKPSVLHGERFCNIPSRRLFFAVFPAAVFFRTNARTVASFPFGRAFLHPRRFGRKPPLFSADPRPFSLHLFQNLPLAFSARLCFT